MPATARFLDAVARLPHGAVVLPGLDIELDDHAWRLIGGRTAESDDELSAPSHPQFALKALLGRFGIKRSDVRQLAEPARGGRGLLVSEAMRPSATTADWSHRLRDKGIQEKLTESMTDIAVIEAPGPEMEALAIAVAMRQARETKLTVALVTPDRALARRVQTALGRWNLSAEDSRGDVLLDLPAGLFARLVAAAIAEQLAPAALLAMLKHPLFRLGRPAGGWRTAIESLELALLRGTRPSSGSAGLAAALAGLRAELKRLAEDQPSSLHRSEPRAQLGNRRLDDVDTLVQTLARALAPLESVNGHATIDFKDVPAKRTRNNACRLSRAVPDRPRRARGHLVSGHELAVADLRSA